MGQAFAELLQILILLWPCKGGELNWALDLQFTWTYIKDKLNITLEKVGIVKNLIIDVKQGPLW